MKSEMINLSLAEKKEIATKVGQAVQSIINNIAEVFQRFGHKISLDEVAHRVSDAIDSKIRFAMKDGNKFIEGRYNIVLVGENAFRAVFEVYLKQINGEFMKLSGESKIFSLNRLEEDGQAELHAKKKICYEINEPGDYIEGGLRHPFPVPLWAQKKLQGYHAEVDEAKRELNMRLKNNVPLKNEVIDLALEKKTEVAADIGKATEDIINDMAEMFGNIFLTQISLDEFAHRASDAIDSKILPAIQDGNKFIDGRYKLELVDKNTFRSSFEIYFRQPSGEFMEMSGESKIFSLNRLKEDGQAELRAKKEISYEIHEPKPATSASVPSATTSNESVKIS